MAALLTPCLYRLSLTLVVSRLLSGWMHGLSPGHILEKG